MLAELFGLALSEGGQACSAERAGRAAQALTGAVRDEIRQSAVLNSDETGARVDGRTGRE